MRGAKSSYSLTYVRGGEMGEDGGSSCTARVGCLWAPCVGRGGGADGCRVPVSGCARLVRVGGAGRCKVPGRVSSTWRRCGRMWPVFWYVEECVYSF